MVDPDPSAYPGRRTTWIILLFGCFAGITTYLATPFEQADQIMLASDVYRHAVESWMTGGDLYGVHPPDRPGYRFLYPPIAVVLFIPHALLGSDLAAYTLQTALNVGAALGTAFVIYRALDRRDVAVDHRDFAILCAFMLLSSYSAIQFINGQVNLWLALALAIGFDAMDRNRSSIAGLAFAFAALLKVFPAIIGVWLLRNRAMHAVGVALATGIGGLLLGALVLGPDLTVTYLIDVLLGRFEGSTYEGRPDPGRNVDGIHRQLAALWPGAGLAHTILAIVILGPLAALTMLDVDTTFRRDVAALGIIVSILLFLPLQPLYFPLIVFPLCMLLYTVPAGRERQLLVVGTVLTLVHLDQESVLFGFQLFALPEAWGDWLVEATTPLYTFILPPTLGLWIILLTCVLIQLPSMEFDNRRVATAPS